MGVWDAGERGEEGGVDDVFVEEGEKEGGEGKGGNEWERHWSVAVLRIVECCSVFLMQCDRCCFSCWTWSLDNQNEFRSPVPRVFYTPLTSFRC